MYGSGTRRAAFCKCRVNFLLFCLKHRLFAGPVQYLFATILNCVFGFHMLQYTHNVMLQRAPNENGLRCFFFALVVKTTNLEAQMRMNTGVWFH